MPERKTPINDIPGGGRSADRRGSNVHPLFRIALTDLRCSSDLRKHIPPDVLHALLELPDPAKTLGLPNDTIVAFAWKVVGIAFAMQGDWVGHVSGSEHERGSVGRDA